MPLGANKAAIMGVAGVSTADVVLLSSQTASGDSEIDFTSGLTSTYGEYIFRFYNLNPTAEVDFTFQGSIDGGSNYNVTMTTTHFEARNQESGSDAGVAYFTGEDQAQGTAFQSLCLDVGAGGDESVAGELHLFNPASTTYVKHYYSELTLYHDADYNIHAFTAGYFNDTNNIDAISFKFASGDFDGTIKMWGVK
jgi:hypothetical protein